MSRRSDVLIATASLASFGVSVYLLFSGQRHGGQYVAISVPSIVSIVTYVRVILALGSA